MSSREQALAANRRLWERWAAINAASAFYDRESFVHDPDGRAPGRVTNGIRLRPYELEEVGDVRGKDLLHLQCHFGLDTLSWARLGARVTGVDFAEAAIEAARALAADCGLQATFVRADYDELPAALPGAFDVVYLSRGVLGWLPDLRRIFGLAADYLRPGGILYLTESHPVLETLDERTDTLTVSYPYFSREQPLAFPVEGSYADRTAEVEEPLEYWWPHPMGEIVTSVAEAGLRVELLRELPYAEPAWERGGLVQGPDGTLVLDDTIAGELPLFFSLRARKT